VVQREIRDFIRQHEARRQQFPRAFLVGLAAGGVAVLFRWALAAGEWAREALIGHLQGRPLWGCGAFLVLGGLAGGAAGWLTRRHAPEAAGSGIPHVKAVLLHLRVLRWRRLLPVKFGAGALGISAGLSLGREGPTVQMGASVGQAVAQFLRVPPRARGTLVAAGAGAGLSAAFNAPLAGFVFVLEELQRDLSPAIFGTALIAAVTADIVTRGASGQVPAFHVPRYAVPPLETLPLFALLGALLGLAGVLFNRCLLGALRAYDHGLSPWARPAVAGLIVGGIGWFVPGAMGSGHGTAERVLGGQVALAAIPALFLVKFALTMVSYGSGAPGGIFAPLLVLGALLGLGLGQLWHAWFPAIVAGPAAFAVAGMAAYFTAIVRAPLTGIVLIVEMTSNYEQLLALMVACLVAYVVADSLGDRPVYEALLERDLQRGREDAALDQTLLLDLPIEAGSALDGRCLREIRLPHGCLLVTVRRRHREFVPHGDTRLRSGDHVTAVVAPEAADAIHLLSSAARAEGASPKTDRGPPR
jgi:CIC family chloride channel protein